MIKELKNLTKKFLILLIILMIFLVIQTIIICSMINSEYYRVFYIENVLIAFCIGYEVSNILKNRDD